MKILPGYISLTEPQLNFEALSNAQHIHPLKGLKEYGPYSSKLLPISNIRLAAIYPEGEYHVIQQLVGEFSKMHKPQERRNYLEDFTGFKSIFGADIELINEKECSPIPANASTPYNYLTLSDAIGNAIRVMKQRVNEFDVLLIYLPERWKNAFEDTNTGFDLHDFIKANCATNNISSQLLRENSVIKYRCRCSVMWRLSIALYVKAGGIPWKLATMDHEAAFIGLSYSTRFNDNTGQYDFTTCCSQVFDADGTGLEFIAYDATEIEARIGENPFLTRAEMRKLMSKSLLLYQRKHAGRLPKRLIVHKTTHFTRQEIDGAFDAIPASVNLELLQIVQDTNWRGIKFVEKYNKKQADGYPLNRGSFFQISQQEILLWTQGNVVLSGNNFYKEGKNIPAPLLIRRFAGKGGWDQNCQAILGLTKMNWNHDALYDRLPVTLGYAKVLATTIKRINTLVNRPYEFKFFM
jgi:hypothetical protein